MLSTRKKWPFRSVSVFQVPANGARVLPAGVPSLLQVLLAAWTCVANTPGLSALKLPGGSYLQKVTLCPLQTLLAQPSRRVSFHTTCVKWPFTGGSQPFFLPPTICGLAKSYHLTSQYQEFSNPCRGDTGEPDHTMKFSP